MTGWTVRGNQMVDDAGTVQAVRWEGNLLGDDGVADTLVELTVDGALVIAGSGSLASNPGEPHPMNWMRPGQEALRERLRTVLPRLADTDAALCLEPNCREVLSDVPACLTILRDFEDLRLGLVPAWLFEPSMLLDAPDHLARIMAALGPRCAYVDLSTETIGGDRLDAALLQSLADEYVPLDTPRLSRAGGSLI